MVRLHQFPQPTEGIHYRNDNIAAFVDSKDLGIGSLFVTEANISWVNGTSGEGFSISYPAMTLHAVAKDEAVHPKPCLYIMLNGYLDEDGTKQPEVEPQDDEEMIDKDEIITEVRFIPDEALALETMYKTVQECTLLHPDPASDMSDDPDEEMEDEDDDMGEEEEDFEDAEEADHGFGRLMERFGLNRDSSNKKDDEPEDPERFADAE